MALKLLTQRDGTPRPYWYAEFKEIGSGDKWKRRVVNLGLKWKGTPPEGLLLSGEGDTLFEASRAKAEAKLAEIVEQVSRKGRAEHLMERVIESKTGRKVEYTRLADLPAKWRALGRETRPTEDWLKWCDTLFNRFAAAVPCEYLHEVTREQAAAYVETLRRNFTNRTASGAASLLKSAFARLLPLGTQNPFEGEIKRRGNGNGGDAIHRRPLTAAELAQLFETARTDSFLYPLTVCAALTGLRIGDVCLLRWASVDLRAGFVTVQTAKTGAGVEIPIFEPLREVFEAALAEQDRDGSYVFPAAARMYLSNRYGIVYRGKTLFARALASDRSAPQDVSENGCITPERSDLQEAFPDVCKTVQEQYAGAKRDRILDSLKRYADGKTYRDIEKETGRQRGQVSQDLKDAEIASGLSFRKGTPEKTGRDLKALIQETRQGRPDGKGKLSASLLGWHSLRGTWATLALSAGIPIETVAKVTGHGTAKTIEKFYYNPRREHLRAVLGDKLPAVLTGHKAAALPPPVEDAPGRLAALAEQLNGLDARDKAQLARMLKTGTKA